MKEVILVKEGEIFLKGLNKKNFEAILVSNIKKSLKDVGNFKILKQQSTITIVPESKGFSLDLAVKKIAKVFGIASFERALVVEKDFEKIKTACKNYLKDELETKKSFKVAAKRSDKNFFLSSPSICAKIGEFLLDEFKNLHVDLNCPDVVVNIEVRDTYAYIYGTAEKGAGGVPVNSAGEGMLLLSGGIDSPVAGWMMAKRGLRLKAIHFISPPYTGERALKKVEDLVLILKEWAGIVPFFIANTTKLQEEIKKNCPQDLLTVILRRCMIKIAIGVIKREEEKGYKKSGALITGESLSQVASQTLGGISCTNFVSSIPILRPLIGMDKEEIVSIARKIGSYETSILPYEDCCSIFSPKHPKTNPKLFEIEKAEKNLNLEELIDAVVEETVLKILWDLWFAKNKGIV